ncbi:hypothetical protein [Streptomyces sp. NPDC054837]
MPDRVNSAHPPDRVVRYPTTHYDALQNLLHVSDPSGPIGCLRAPQSV